jgi:voltage-gated potassium channel
VPEQRRAVGYVAWERRVERPMLVLALVFLVVLVVPMVTDLPPAGRTAFTAADVAIWAAFAVDYAARLYLAPARWRFVRSHLLDLLVLVVPFLRPLRALRLLRIARLGVVAGVAHSRAQRSLHATVAVYVTTAAAGLLVLAATAMYDVERRAPSGNIKTFPDALWWAITTVTTVGYGDRYPTTGTGRLVGGALMLVGIALLGVITASIAAWFVDRLRDVQVAETTTEAALGEVLAELKALHTRLDAIERQPRVVEQAKPSSAPAPLPSQARQR